MGHWARVCLNCRSVNEVTESERVEQTSSFLGSVCDANEKSEQWTVQLHVDSTPMKFNIDTTVDVIIINEDTFHALTLEKTLEPLDIPLDSSGGELLCLGCFIAIVSHKERDYPVAAYVVHGQGQQFTQTDPISKGESVKQIDEENPAPFIWKPIVNMACLKLNRFKIS